MPSIDSVMWVERVRGKREIELRLRLFRIQALEVTDLDDEFLFGGSRLDEDVEFHVRKVGPLTGRIVHQQNCHPAGMQWQLRRMRARGWMPFADACFRPFGTPNG